MEADNDSNEAGAPKTYMALMMADDYKSTVTKSICRPPKISPLKALAKPGIRRILDVKFKRASEMSGKEFKAYCRDYRHPQAPCGQSAKFFEAKA